MDIKRRTLLRSALAGGAVAMGGGFFPYAASAEWLEAAFAAKDSASALEALLGDAKAIESNDIQIKVPDVAENGAVVPVEITTSLPEVESISILAENNRVPLVATFNFPDPALSAGYVHTRIKMASSSPVEVVVKSKGQLYTAKKEVKVTVGGCGGS